MGEVGPCLIVVWRGTVREDAIHRINDHIWTLTRQRPGACAYINVIESNSPPPSASLRKLVMDGITRPGKALTCLGAVFEGNELRTALVRAVMTGMAMLRRSAQPTKFFKNTQDMAVWVEEQLRAAGTVADRGVIVRAAEIVRGHMPVQS